MNFVAALSEDLRRARSGGVGVAGRGGVVAQRLPPYVLAAPGRRRRRLHAAVGAARSLALRAPAAAGTGASAPRGVQCDVLQTRTGTHNC